ncbi:MAG TPA: hypothetical protein VK539_21495 [Myxococcaceae bacterium]|nr:hypothetical protein [Myxococcaceae bacterium]
MSTCPAFALPRPRQGYGWLLLCAALASVGCATAPGPRGPVGTYHLAGAADTSWTQDMGWAWQEERSGEHTASSRPQVPSGWPEEASSDEELLAPFLACASTADFLALQRGVDMPGVVQRLGDWSAVRLGALGPLVDARASQLLIRKRAAFLLTSVADHGVYAQVFALFIVHTSFDDELHPLLRLLSGQKQLAQTLGHMEAVREELKRRGFKLSDYADRDEQAGDVLRGLRSAARDALNSSPASQDGRFLSMWNKSRQLPPAYQRAVDGLTEAVGREHYSPGSVALGGVDHLTFGVPLGFYHLVAGTGHGVETLAQGHYEQAARELAPATVLVALYAGGKSARYLAEGRGTGARARLALPQLRLEALKQVAWQVRERLGLEGLAELARYLRGSRESAVFVGAGGEPAAVALYEARGNVARAQAWLSEAKPERAGAPEPRPATGKALGGVASLVDEAAGYSAQVVEAKLRQAELEAPGPRLPADVALLERLRATLDAPPPGVPEGYALWGEYVTYRQRRLAELGQGKAKQGPLRWEPYERMRGAFARGLAFERLMVEVLRADADLPVARRRWLQGFNQPLIEVHVGVSKPSVPGTRFADVLVLEQQPPAGQTARVETFSFKSRYLASLDGDGLGAQMVTDARAALDCYGGTLNILRRSLKQGVKVQRVRLVYEGGDLMPENPKVLDRAMRTVKKEVKEVEVLVQ